MPITWRTVQGPEQGSANQLAQAGANTSLQGLQALGAALKAPQARQEQQAKDAFAQGLQLSQLSQGQQRIDNQNRQFEADQIFRAGQSALDRGLQQSLMKSTQGHDLLKLGMQHEFTDAQRQAAEAYDTLARGAGYKHAADMQDKGFTFKDGQLVKMQDHEIDLWNKRDTAAVKAATVQHGRGLEFLGKEQTFAKDQQGRALGHQASESSLGRAHQSSENALGRSFTGEQNRLSRALTASEGGKNRSAAATRSANAVDQKIAAEKRKMDNDKAMLKWKRDEGYLTKDGDSKKSGTGVGSISADKYLSSPGYKSIAAKQQEAMSPKQIVQHTVMSQLAYDKAGGDSTTANAIVAELFEPGTIYDTSYLESDPAAMVDAVTAAHKRVKAIGTRNAGNGEGNPVDDKAKKILEESRARR